MRHHAYDVLQKETYLAPDMMAAVLNLLNKYQYPSAIVTVFQFR